MLEVETFDVHSRYLKKRRDENEDWRALFCWFPGLRGRFFRGSPGRGESGGLRNAELRGSAPSRPEGQTCGGDRQGHAVIRGGGIFLAHFWGLPKDLKKLNAERVSILKDFYRSYENLTGEKAYELAERVLDFEAGGSS